MKLSRWTFLCFLYSGHFLLSSSSHDGKCEHQITSPDLPGSDKQCILQVALYEAGPTVGNLTVQVKLVMSDLIVRSEVLNNRRPENHRSGTASSSLCTIISHLFGFVPQMLRSLSVLLVSRTEAFLAALAFKPRFSYKINSRKLRFKSRQSKVNSANTFFLQLVVPVK